MIDKSQYNFHIPKYRYRINSAQRRFLLNQVINSRYFFKAFFVFFENKTGDKFKTGPIFSEQIVYSERTTNLSLQDQKLN